MIEHAHTLLSEAVYGVDRFEQRNRVQLTTAVNEASAVRRRIEDVTAAARRVDEALAGVEPAYLRFPSVTAAVAEFQRARRVLAQENENHRLAAASRAAGHVEDAAAALRKALEDAPAQHLRAQRSIASGRTRAGALAHRITAVRPNLSALLREFSAAGSVDLMRNEVLAAAEIAAARDLLDRATAAVGDARHEDALHLAKEARRHLADAEELVNSVAQRLDLLRRLREDPEEAERRVRFELRDAQRLALSLDVVDEWASVLDAQLARIDRIVAALDTPRPDFWEYSKALDQVSRFIAVVVAKIRASARNGR